MYVLLMMIDVLQVQVEEKNEKLFISKVKRLGII